MSDCVSKYRRYSEHLKNKFGVKVYKLPINLPGTAPTGTASKERAGVFCDEEGRA